MKPSWSMFFLLISLLISGHMLSQEEVGKSPIHTHRISVVLGHAYVPTGLNAEGQSRFLGLPTWGLDYDYWVGHHWAIGIHSDIIIENFAVERIGGDNSLVLERSYPISVALTGLRRFGEHFNLMVGLGPELAEEEVLWLLRLGAEYGWEIYDNWEVGISLMNDFKVDAYGTFIVGIGISRLIK